MFGQFRYFKCQIEVILETFWSNWLRVRHVTTFPSILANNDADGGIFFYYKIVILNILVSHLAIHEANLKTDIS